MIYYQSTTKQEGSPPHRRPYGRFGSYGRLFALLQGGLLAFGRVPFGVSVFILHRRCFCISNMSHQINEEITDREIRLISVDGEQLGVMSAAQALDKAVEADLDLVKISPTATPPVCKLMDYGKFRFEQTKRDKEAKKNQHIVEIKEVRMSPSIDIGDFNVKLRNAQKFLAEGNRVKVTVRFRGREMAHTDIGRTQLFKFAEQCSEMATLDKDPKLEGRHMSIFLSPKVNKELKTSNKETTDDA